MLWLSRAAGVVTAGRLSLSSGVRPHWHDFAMKSISASIIVLAAAGLIVGGSYIQHSDSKLFVQVVGCVFGAVGLGVWFVSIREK